MLKTFTLKNGIKVATYNLPDLKSVHLRIVTKGGFLVQEQEKNGVAHLMEHMLVQGIPALPTAEKFSEYIEGFAGSYGAYTQQLLVGFDLTLPIFHLHDGLEIVGETFFKPLFDSDALRKEKGVVIDEIKQRMDAKWFKISQFFLKSRFKKNHLLTLDLAGSIPKTRKLKNQDLLEFWKKCFLPENAYLIVVGNFAENKLKSLLSQHLEKYQIKGKLPNFPKMSRDDFSKETVSLRHDKNLRSNYLDISFPSLSLSDSLEERMKQSLALTILGRLRNSRLFKLLRYKKGLVYDIRVGSNMLPGLGYINITSEVSREHLVKVLEEIINELADFVAKGPTEEELKFAKNFLTNYWFMAFDHPTSIAGWIEGELLWEKKIMLPEETAKRLDLIGVKDLIAVMQKNWDFSKINLTIQGAVKVSPKTIKNFKEILKKVNIASKAF